MTKKYLPALIFSCLIILVCHESNKHNAREIHLQNDFEKLRTNMVDFQIKRRGIKNNLVLNAMKKVPRHKFVPKEYRSLAYRDHPLPIGADQTISQPYIVAFMTECLKLTGNEKVLEIGTGSGYQAAVLAEIADKVYTIEIIQSLLDSAVKSLEQSGYTNVFTRCADGYQGWPEEAPFDCIIVTAAPDHIPQPLVNQLKPGGRMIIPVGDYYQELILIKKAKDGKISRRSVLPVRFVPMTGEAQL